MTCAAVRADILFGSDFETPINTNPSSDVNGVFITNMTIDGTAAGGVEGPGYLSRRTQDHALSGNSSFRFGLSYFYDYRRFNGGNVNIEDGLQKPRTEMSWTHDVAGGTSARLEVNKEYWLGVAIFIPEEFILDYTANPDNVFQLHKVDGRHNDIWDEASQSYKDRYTPNAANITLFDNVLEIELSDNINAQGKPDFLRHQFEITKGVWHQIVLHFKFTQPGAANANDGFYEIYLDGNNTPVLSTTGPNTYATEYRVTPDFYKYNWHATSNLAAYRASSYYDPVTDSGIGDPHADYDYVMSNPNPTRDNGTVNAERYFYIDNLFVGDANSSLLEVAPNWPVPTSIPSVPTGVAAAAGDAQVTLSWSSVAGAASYSVKRSSAAGGPYTVVGTGVTGISFVDTAVTVGTTYYYVVSASNALGESDPSAEVSAVPVVNLNVAAPSFSPAGGAYTAPQVVTLASATAGASIRYTTNGSAPTSATGTLYSSPINIAATTTLKAIAYKTAMTDSLVVAATYVIEEPPPSSAVFHDGFQAYSVGPLPRADAAPYLWAASGEMVSTVEADNADRFGRGATNNVLRLEDTGSGNQAMGTNAFVIGTTGQISFEFNLPANFNSFTTANSGLLLRIGTNPNSGTFTSGTTRFSLGLHAGGTVRAANNLNQVLNGADFAPFSFDEPHKLTLAFNNTASPVAYVTGGGSIPADSMDVWLDGVLIGTMGSSNSSSGLPITTLYFLNRVGNDTGVAYIDEVNFSDVLSGGADVTADPVFSPIPGTYIGPQSVELSSSTVGAAIRYTTDGSDPSPTSGTLYTGPIDVVASTTLKAIAYRFGYLASVVSEGAYEIESAPPTEAVFFDDFESYAPGALPRGNGPVNLWASSGSMVSLVESDGQNHFGHGTSNQVLYFEDTGSGNQTLGTNVFPIGTTGQVAFDFYLPTGFNSATGGHPGLLLRLGTSSSDGNFSVSSTRFALGFHASGVIKAADNANLALFGEILGSFAFDAPQRLTLAFNNTASPVPYLNGTGAIAPNTVDVWLDQELIGTVSAANSSSGESITSLSILNRVGNDTGVGYFDNVTFSNALTGGQTNAPSPAAAPQFNPNGGSFIGSQSVSISSATPTAIIRYTLDGSTPSETTGTIYAGPVSLAATATLKAVAYGDGLASSVVTSADYVIILPPVVTAQPSDLTVTSGDPATFAVSVVGPGPLMYQWRKDGVAIAGATAAAYTLPVALVADAGAYDVVVSNAAGAITSGAAQLTVNKAHATVQLTDLAATFDGQPHAATVTTKPASLVVNVTYDGASDLPVNAGSYAVAAAVDDDNFEGSATDTLVIAKAPVVVGFDNLSQRYTGEARVVTVVTQPEVDVTVTYDGSLTPPTLPGEYVVEATVTGDSNYEGEGADILVVTITALVRHSPTLNGGLDGSAQVLLPESITLNGSAWVSGDLLVVGSPSLRLNGSPVFASTLEATGAAEPSSHRITLNGHALLRHLVTRVDALELTSVDAPPAPSGTRSVSLNQPGDSAGDFATLRNLTLNGNVGSIAIPAGTYGNLTANGGSGLVLGEAGATEPIMINLQSLTLNGNSQVEIVGPVILTLAHGVSLNGSVGSADHPEWLVLRVANGSVTLNGSVAFHGTVLAPSGTVTINGSSSLHGDVEADRLMINGNGVLEEPED